MKIEKLKVKDLKPYENNAKIHTREQIEKIKRSIQEFGNNDPIAVDETGMVIEGHGRLQALQELGYEEVECIRLIHLSDEQKRAYILVHNKLTMETGFDLDALADELAQIDSIDMSDFNFELNLGDQGGNWFEDHEVGASKNTEGESEEYKEFVEKFEQKLTTDDCYTPAYIFDVIADWVAAKYELNRDDFVRPFYPGGDYQADAEQYRPGQIVVDNPPFSILSEIIRFYTERGIRFFLFCPGLTAPCRAADKTATILCSDSEIEYENGAVIRTNFVTNLEKEYQLRTEPDLREAVKAAVDKHNAETKPELAKHEYPDELATVAMLNKLSRYGIDYKIPMGSCCRVSELEAQKELGFSIYGGGYLLSEKAAAEKAAAEKAAAEKAAAEKAAALKWQLTEREWAIVKSLGKDEAEA